LETAPGKYVFHLGGEETANERVSGRKTFRDKERQAGRQGDHQRTPGGQNGETKERIASASGSFRGGKGILGSAHRRKFSSSVRYGVVRKTVKRFGSPGSTRVNQGTWMRTLDPPGKSQIKGAGNGDLKSPRGTGEICRGDLLQRGMGILFLTRPQRLFLGGESRGIKPCRPHSSKILKYKRPSYPNPPAGMGSKEGSWGNRKPSREER